MKLRTLAAAAVACLMLTCFAASPARADAINANQWYTFGFDETGDPLVSGATVIIGAFGIAAPDAPWTITLATPMLLVVTDGFQQGDEFELFDFGLSIGSTSANADDSGHSCSNNEITCLADPLMSHGSFLLAAGDHSLTGIVTDSPFGGGAGFFIITQQVPEPGALALLGIALAGLAFIRRKRAA
jgi:hypothetical protein